MKILFIFIDMIRPSLLNLWDSTLSETPLDHQLKSLGGVIFTNCYTPAPDTPRSHGCLWTSRYPKFNGCNTRLKYPRYYLYDDVPNLIQILRDNGYSLNIYENGLRWITDKQKMSAKVPFFGIINTNTSSDYYSHGMKLEEYLDGLEVKDNSLTLLQFSDFHCVVDDYFALKKHVRKHGFEIASHIFDCIRSKLCLDDFDLTVFYSDHGFMASGEDDGTVMSMLSKTRNQIMMFVRRKGDNCLFRDKKLSSIMDVFPTVLNLCNIPYDKDKIDGHDLFSEPGHDMLLIEDYNRIYVYVDANVDIWGVRTKNGLACVDTKLNWTSDYPLTESEKAKFTSFLSEKASEFALQARAASIQNLTHGNGLFPSTCYFDGSKRKKLLIKRILTFIKYLGGYIPRIKRFIFSKMH